MRLLRHTARFQIILSLTLTAYAAGEQGANANSQSAAPASSEIAEGVSDREISLAVENELLSSDAVSSHKIDVTSNEGIVTLSGKVDSLLAQQAADRIAQRVKGVISVVNRIVIIAGDRKDAEIAEDVLQAWSADSATESGELRVEVVNGTGKLAGKVDSPVERILAEQIAEGVRGIVAVENNIEVVETDERANEEIQNDLQRLIDSDAILSDSDVHVAVEDEQVLLTGKVPTSFAKTRATELAQRSGVQNIDARGLLVDYERYDGTRRRRRLEELTDEHLVEAVRLALRYDPRVLSYLDTIEVESDGGSITLSGAVGRLRAKQAAEETARGTLGVWRVRNNLKVRWSESDPPAHEIVDFVQAALLRDPYVSRHEIRVHCRNGHVSLYGLVDSDFEKKTAGWIAGGQKGVVHVNNYLSVPEDWVPRSDAEIKADIDEKLARTFFDRSNEVDVTVEDGVAILRGEVDTWRQWQWAMELAVEAGARRPHNLIKVRYHPRHGGSRIYVPE
ncbi:MAG: BON domain-containing protein [Planctomycetota bacterium]|nr:MAG: BON domain-containing protein [Planctomycetota bacterium]